MYFDSRECEPEKAMRTIKSRATINIREIDSSFAGEKVWTRHGSTKYIWKREGMRRAIDYVVKEQGEPMVLWV